MGSKMCSLFSFFCAAKGNWRNSVYIECGGCRYGRRIPCAGFLMVPDYDGQPVVIPAGVIHSMTGLAADKDECKAILRRQDFETLYALWLEWHVSSPDECALLQAVSEKECGGRDRKTSCCYQQSMDGQCVLNQ